MSDKMESFATQKCGFPLSLKRHHNPDDDDDREESS